jgi:uncharacterized protein YjiS (DUF1127 family)
MSVMPLGGPAGPAYSQTQSLPALAIGLAQIGSALWSAVRPIARLVLKAIAERHTRRAVRDLQYLDDRLLRDIGLNRAMIEHAVRHGRGVDVIPFGWARSGTPGVSQTFSRPE